MTETIASQADSSDEIGPTLTSILAPSAVVLASDVLLMPDEVV
jgi:hypothetical protein